MSLMDDGISFVKVLEVPIQTEASEYIRVDVTVIRRGRRSGHLCHGVYVHAILGEEISNGL